MRKFTCAWCGNTYQLEYLSESELYDSDICIDCEDGFNEFEGILNENY